MVEDKAPLTDTAEAGQADPKTTAPSTEKGKRNTKKVIKEERDQEPTPAERKGKNTDKADEADDEEEPEPKPKRMKQAR